MIILNCVLYLTILMGIKIIEIFVNILFVNLSLLNFYYHVVFLATMCTVPIVLRKDNHMKKIDGI